MISKRSVNKICCEDPSLIENYDLAINDTTQMWHIHHRKETDENLSANELKRSGLYYNRPTSELIFLTKHDHHVLHNKYFHQSEISKKKISDNIKGENHPNYGKHHSTKTKSKISKTLKGKFVGENHHNYGKHWFNNGIKNILAFECPKGYIQGILKRI